jgi:hypothetical protein
MAGPLELLRGAGEIVGGGEVGAEGDLEGVGIVLDGFVFFGGVADRGEAFGSLREFLL